VTTSRWGESSSSQFRATQQQILDRLVSEGYTVHAFHGGHSSSEKEQIVEDFEEEEESSSQPTQSGLDFAAGTLN